MTVVEFVEERIKLVGAVELMGFDASETVAEGCRGGRGGRSEGGFYRPCYICNVTIVMLIIGN